MYETMRAKSALDSTTPSPDSLKLPSLPPPVVISVSQDRRPKARPSFSLSPFSFTGYGPPMATKTASTVRFRCRRPPVAARWRWGDCGWFNGDKGGEWWWTSEIGSGVGLRVRMGGEGMVVKGEVSWLVSSVWCKGGAVKVAKVLDRWVREADGGCCSEVRW
ncbi:hypothetical protein V6N11_031349 [Hibiscus sabdariffa]|uniref:Uncharacterized protein n=1 Tax=Hibiscus sabdariffa TaxID=183260 RepID=A0ABR2SXD2_9ROSI